MATANNSESIPFYDVFGFYEWTLTLADPRTTGWPMVDSAMPTFVCVCIYLFIVWIGPKIMRDRKPFELKTILVPYNLAIALLNLYICVQLFVGSTMLQYSYICEPYRHSFDPAELRVSGQKKNDLSVTIVCGQASLFLQNVFLKQQPKKLHSTTCNSFLRCISCSVACVSSVERTFVTSAGKWTSL
uniref:Elongation of very long chain fatty acids protein n=1 Tax=Anopheles atroparvus TaxID=41427 RepID=A0AAG5DMQ9_ANOAO